MPHPLIVGNLSSRVLQVLRFWPVILLIAIAVVVATRRNHSSGEIERFLHRADLQSDLLAKQKVCLEYRDLPETIVFAAPYGGMSYPLPAEMDYRLPAVFIPNDEDGIVGGYTWRTSGGYRLQDLEKAATRAARWQWKPEPPKPKDVYHSGYDWPPILALLHARQAPNALRRLVAVEVDWIEGAPDNGQAVLTAHVYSTAGTSTGLNKTARTANWVSPDRPPASLELTGRGDSLIIYAGQPDPHDHARFTIDVQRPQKRVRIEGRLRADDIVDFRLIEARE